MRLSNLIPTSQNKQYAVERRRAELYKSLIHYEAKIGGEVFGPIPEGYAREFFCLDERTWMWHEEWTDESGRRHIMTTRYDVRPNGVFKSQGTNSYRPLSAEEASRLYDAVVLYYQRVMPELQRLQLA
ncbi:MAG TPA: hypothetical protein VGG13_02175 [Candidatus Saccharimonadales bacterium]|jgi:hypothetical protein